MSPENLADAIEQITHTLYESGREDGQELPRETADGLRGQLDVLLKSPDVTRAMIGSLTDESRLYLEGYVTGAPELGKFRDLLYSSVA